MTIAGSNFGARLPWVMAGWIVCAPTFVWQAFLRSNPAATTGDRVRGSPVAEPPSESIIAPRGSLAKLATEVAKRLELDVELRGEAAAGMVFGSLEVVRTSQVQLALFEEGQRWVSAGSTLGSGSEDEKLRYFRVGAELVSCSAGGNPVRLERAADAFVAAGDLSRLLGMDIGCQRWWSRGIEVYSEILALQRPVPAAIRARVERKHKRSLGDLEQLEVSGVGTPGGVAAPSKPGALH
jgi:hypothetical protein